MGMDEVGEDVAMSSVVYLGRGSFRMEAVVEDADDDGAPREVTGIVTSPYRTRGEGRADEVFSRLDEDATEIMARARAGRWRADVPSLPDPLFGSQTKVPLLTAPTGHALPRGPRRLSLSRGALAAAGAMMFAGGLGAGAAAWHAAGSTARPSAPTPPAPVAAPREVAAKPAQMRAAPTPAAMAPSVIELPEPILVRVHNKPAAVSANAGTRRAPAVWVDPFAD